MTSKMRKSKKTSSGNSRSSAKFKRWFANAAGWGFQLSIGSGVSQSTGSKVKREFSGTSDSQIYHATSTVAPTQDLVYVVNALAGITAGATSSGRLGDRIFIESLNIRNLVSNLNAHSPDFYRTFRVMLVASTTQDLNTSWLVSANLTAAHVFRQFVYSNVIALPDPQLCRVLCDEVITINPTITGTAVQAVLNLNCTVKEWFEYQPGTGVGVAANLYWLLIGNTVGTANNTDVIGTVYTDFAAVYHN